MSIWRLAVLLAATGAVVLSLIRLQAPYGEIETVHGEVAGTPITIQRQPGDASGPIVVIAHGFAGSRQLMQPFAVTLALNGYTAISFDFLGHGGNPTPLTGDVTKEEGATLALLQETQKIIAHARTLAREGQGVALLGHSMASDILVRAAVEDPEVAATVVVSMFSEQVTAETPPNLLMIVGEYERFLTNAAIETLRLSGVAAPEEATTYPLSPGNIRRVAIADGVEHASVLYSRESMTEAVRWLDTVFDREAGGPVEHRAPWLGLLFAGIVALGWPLAGLLRPVPFSAQPMRTGRFLVLLAAPAAATPLILWPLPTGFMPVLVADYLALHFLLYGALTAGALFLLTRPTVRWPQPALILQSALAALFVTGAIAVPLDLYVASFLPGANRVVLIGVLALGTLAYSLADEWLIARPGATWWWYPASKLAILLSLAAAVALNLSELFFLIIILPVILLFFILYGLFSRWLLRSTGHPSIGGVALGIAFAWALGVTFPLLAN
ncbi:MAG: alpha/beta fold hydrolase [Pseudomonadota bacterium]